ncbi:MAG: hypothetical protein HOV83_36265, partial [Catenulispora sp.]|nr:hypothetical protein [Catenulispora sp.]
MSVHVYGVRHHGPGSARALVRALEDLRPDVILVEGPPEADGLVALAGHEDLRPPVALLAYPADVAGSADGDRSRASFWPFAVFSPEWQALRYAAAHGVPLRFCDLPASYRFAVAATNEGEKPAEEPDGPLDSAEEEQQQEEAFRQDPIAQLATAAGYEDPERWWEDVIEHRREGEPAFAAVAEAMAAVRAGQSTPEYDALREAYMRQTLRAAMKEGFERIAVVCGAWHVPALTEPLPSAAHDAALLKGLPKTAVQVTWVPWTHGRLASWTGYGAGVTSPGWYHHLFTTADRPVERWLVAVAGMLREQDIPVSSAHVIEAVRLAETLAALRGRPAVGLSEASEAVRAVLCDGDDVRHELVRSKMIVGELLGEVPDETPSVPLVRDVTAQAKRLRMPQEALVKDLRLDLRKPNDLARSRLLHRLGLLGVAWGRPAESSGKGTFWESWQLAWEPEFAVDLIAASAYGTTVALAAAGKVRDEARAADLARLTELIEGCLLADLPAVQPRLIRAIYDRAALGTDVADLMAAIPALARSLRYGDVRGTGTGPLRTVLTGLVTRIQLGLPGAVSGLDDDAARAMLGRIDAVTAAVGLLTDEPGLRDEWLSTLAGLVDRPDLPGLLAGRMARLLRDEGRCDADETEVRLARALTVGVPAATSAGYVEGFLSGGGLLLVHDDALLSLVDRWLTGLAGETFTQVLPLLRRTFAEYSGPERRAIGERVRNAGTRAAAAAEPAGFDAERVARIIPVLRTILGSPGGPLSVSTAAD